MLASDILLSLALISGQSCEQVFVDTVILDARVPSEEMPLLFDLARAACASPMPDVVWRIARVETNFRFKIARLNSNEEVLRGLKASEHLLLLESGLVDGNVDVGVMQINWLFHARGFGFDARKMAKPSAQVAYLFDTMHSQLVERCGQLWIGCYHSWTSRDRAKKYQKNTEEAGRVLARLAERVAILRGIETRGFSGYRHQVGQVDLSNRYKKRYPSSSSSFFLSHQKTSKSLLDDLLGR